MADTRLTPMHTAAGGTHPKSDAAATAVLKGLVASAAMEAACEGPASDAAASDEDDSYQPASDEAESEATVSVHAESDASSDRTADQQRGADAVQGEADDAAVDAAAMDAAAVNGGPAPTMRCTVCNVRPKAKTIAYCTKCQYVLYRVRSSGFNAASIVGKRNARFRLYKGQGITHCLRDTYKEVGPHTPEDELIMLVVNKLQGESAAHSTGRSGKRTAAEGAAADDARGGNRRRTEVAHKRSAGAGGRVAGTSPDCSAPVTSSPAAAAARTPAAARQVKPVLAPLPKEAESGEPIGRRVAAPMACGCCRGRDRTPGSTYCRRCHRIVSKLRKRGFTGPSTHLQNSEAGSSVRFYKGPSLPPVLRAVFVELGTDAADEEVVELATEKIAAPRGGPGAPAAHAPPVSEKGGASPCTICKVDYACRSSTYCLKCNRLLNRLRKCGYTVASMPGHGVRRGACLRVYNGLGIPPCLRDTYEELGMDATEDALMARAMKKIEEAGSGGGGDGDAPAAPEPRKKKARKVKPASTGREPAGKGSDAAAGGSGEAVDEERCGSQGVSGGVGQVQVGSGESVDRDASESGGMASPPAAAVVPRAATLTKLPGDPGPVGYAIEAAPGEHACEASARFVPAAVDGSAMAAVAADTTATGEGATGTPEATPSILAGAAVAPEAVLPEPLAGPPVGGAARDSPELPTDMHGRANGRSECHAAVANGLATALDGAPCRSRCAAVVPSTQQAALRDHELPLQGSSGVPGRGVHSKAAAAAAAGVRTYGAVAGVDSVPCMLADMHDALAEDGVGDLQDSLLAAADEAAVHEGVGGCGDLGLMF